MYKHLIFCLISFGLFLSGCETDDVILPVGEGPEVVLTLDPLVITEKGGMATLTANLAESTESDVIITFTFSGSAEKNVEYTVSSEQLTILQGSLSNQITITAIDDSVKLDNKTVEIAILTIVAGSSASDQIQTLTIEDDETPNTAAIIINEVLYDPPSGATGDANGDGTRDPNQDEFIEFVNLSASAIDMSNYEIYDAEALLNNTPRHIFPSGSIVSPGKVILIFGGGTPTGSFGNATLQTASSGSLNMTNSDDFITIKAADGTVLLTYDVEALSNNPDESYTRNPDLTGSFEQHNDNTPLLFSPGTKIDASPF
jgi:hypothetical protein